MAHIEAPYLIYNIRYGVIWVLYGNPIECIAVVITINATTLVEISAEVNSNNSNNNN